MNGLIQPVLIGFALALGLVPLCRIVAHRTGVVAHPRNDRWHRSSVPMLGGVAIALAILIGTVALGIARPIAVLLVSAMLISFTGLVDDVISLKPATKLIAQIVLAATLVYFGYRLNWVESRLFDSMLTMMWVVGLTNAFNLLDNMDGLCAGTAIVVAVMLGAGVLAGAGPDRANAELSFLGLLAGAVAGFLVFNFPPASIFMGDSGSLLLGFSLASLTLNNEGIRGSRSDVLSVIAAPVFVLLLPIFDTTLVTISRLLSGRSPAMGGRDHSSHRLVAIGLSERAAVFVLWALAAMGGLIGITLRTASQEWSLVAAALFVIGMCLFAVYLARVRVYEDSSEAAKAGELTPLSGEFMYKRRVAEVVLDFCLVAIAYYVANRLRFEGEAFLNNSQNFYQSLPLMLAAQLIAFFIVGVYRGTWHQFGLMDGVTIGGGVLLGTTVAQVVIANFFQDTSYSRTVFLIYALLIAGLMVSSRASVRLMGEVVLRRRRASRRALIYGAAEHAAAALQELYEWKGQAFRVVGFVDDDPRMARMRVQGYPVIGNTQALLEIITAHNIDTVVLNHRNLDAGRRGDLEALCRSNGVSLLRLDVSVEEIVPPA